LTVGGGRREGTAERGFCDGRQRSMWVLCKLGVMPMMQQNSLVHCLRKPLNPRVRYRCLRNNYKVEGYDAETDQRICTVTVLFEHSRRECFYISRPLLLDREFHQLAVVRRQRSTFPHQTVSQRGPRPLSLSIHRGRHASRP
jgi:hypothetical protein